MLSAQINPINYVARPWVGTSKGNAMIKAIIRPALLATSVALSPLSAAPARADETTDTIAAVTIFGLLAAGILSNLGNDAAQAAPNPATNGNRWEHWNDGWGSHHGTPRVTSRKVLPQQCEFTIRHGSNRGIYFDRRCLKQKFEYWGYLPGQCETRVTPPYRAHGRSYTATCLNHFGYQVAELRPRH